MTRIALTGSGGLVGAAVRRRKRQGSLLSLHDGPDGSTPDALCSDIGDTATLMRVFDGCSALIHAAGPPSVAASFQDPKTCVTAHVVGAASVLEAAARAGVRRAILISSAEIYGASADPVSEHRRPAPRSPYGAAKLGAEALFSAAHRAGAIETVILRPFSVYGPGLRPDGLIGEIFTQVHGGARDIRLRNLAPVRDYIYADDLADAIWQALDLRPGVEPAIYNIAQGVGLSVRDLVEATGEALNRKLRATEAIPKDRPSDIDSLVADISAARADLNWQPGHALRAGLRKTYDDLIKGQTL